MVPTDQNIEEFVEKLVSLDRIGAEETVTAAIAGQQPFLVIEKLIVPALERIGQGWEKGTISLSQIYMGSRICEEVVNTILPLSDSNRTNHPKMAIALLDDYHALGKIIVLAALRASGYEMQDYGTLDTAALVSRIQEESIEIILISTLMLHSALRIRELRESLNKAGLETVKIIVGGAPFRFDPELWQEVGADAMGSSGLEAVQIIENLLEESI